MDNNITIQNVKKMPFKELLTRLGDLVLKPIPQGALNDPDVLTDLDEQLGYWANLHTWLIYLWSYISNETNKARLIGPDENAEMNKRKEMLYELAASVKLKRESVSRMLTIKIELEQESIVKRNLNPQADDDMPFGKKAGKGTKSAPPKESAWASV